MTDEETYQRLKELHKENPDLYMSPEEWKKIKIIALRKSGTNWSY